MKKYNFIKEVLVHPMQLKSMGYRVYDEIKEFYNHKENLIVVTILNGGFTWNRLVFSNGRMPKSLTIQHFNLSAKSYGDDTTSSGTVMIDAGSMERVERLATMVKDNHVLIVDDIYDSGRTLDNLTTYLYAFSPKSIECCVMIERVCEHFVEIKPKFVGAYLDTQDFLVGAGLDFKDDYRSLPYIATVDTNPAIERHYEKYVCNKCGEDCNSVKSDSDPGIPEQMFYGLLNAKVLGNYYSPVLEDCTAYKFDICEKCLKELFDSFVIPVEEREASPWGDEVYG